jgi:hypothetical protein
MVLSRNDWEALRWLRNVCLSPPGSKSVRSVDNHKIDGIVEKGLAEYRPFTKVLAPTEEGMRLILVLDVMES